MSKIWNPQTNGQKIMSRMFIPAGLRDNASRACRTRLALSFTVWAIASYAALQIQKNQIEELKEEQDRSIRVPSFKFSV